jgi:hypothetical protein
VDFPDDPDCSSASDDSEGVGAGGPQCSDGVDNDGDGKVDFPDDPQCSSESDATEADEALATTGVDVLAFFLIGALALGVGIPLREAASRLERNDSMT